MNEKQTAYAIRRELDHAAATLPAEMTTRLHAARTASLAHLAPQTSRVDPDTPPFWTRFAIATVPIAFMAVGLSGIAQWADSRQSEQFAQELAALDEAILVDELPIAAYTDKGFAVFLENTRQ